MLPSLIHGDQTSYIKGRFIGQNVRLIADIIECTDTLDIEGIALLLDFKKAFDSLEWNFILNALETFGLGASLVQWVKTFYNNIQSCVINRELTNRRLSHDGAAGSPYSPAPSSCRNLNLRFAVKTMTFMRDRQIFSPFLKFVFSF